MSTASTLDRTPQFLTHSTDQGQRLKKDQPSDVFSSMSTTRHQAPKLALVLAPREPALTVSETLRSHGCGTSLTSPAELLWAVEQNQRIGLIVHHSLDAAGFSALALVRQRHPALPVLGADGLAVSAFCAELNRVLGP